MVARAHRTPQPLLLVKSGVIQLEIEIQHIDSRLSEETPLSVLGVLGDEIAHLLLSQAASLGDTPHLKFGSRRRDVRI